MAAYVNNTSLLSELQSTSLAEDSISFIEGKDLNYQGYDLSDKKSEFELTGIDAIKNKVLFWLTSTPGDFVRDPNKGGILYSVLGKTINPDRIERIKSNIFSYFEDNFQGELNLLDVSVLPKDLARRSWKITLFVRDPLSRENFKVAVDAKQ